MWAWTIGPIEPKSVIKRERAKLGRLQCVGAHSLIAVCVRRRAEKKEEREIERESKVSEFFCLTIGGQTLSVSAQILCGESLQQTLQS